MTNEDSIFNEALAILSPRERVAFLDSACSGKADLRQRIDSLLIAYEKAGSFLEAPPTDIAPSPEDWQSLQHSAPHPGEYIGPYKLLEQIGEGGMGVVFMAEQLMPVRRRVALKIIKPGMDTKQVIARFDAERQALALMDHPNIAKVLEVGTTAAGRPYFVMELVKGVPITEYCDEQKLSPRQRLDLFIQVCQAVQHAHQKGIIHRDLKPRNVLVTHQDGTPAPKIIDFGIAKAIGNEPLTDQTLFTELRQLVGTPLYMSPEQAEVRALIDVDTRSDVYSLGVLLYELLTGATPFDKQRLAKAAYDEVRRIIREEEPPRPSTRISTLGETLTSVAAQRQVDPKRLGGLLCGELDWIVMRALEKDRARRYGTATELAQDVERYLSDQPVQACPPSRLYHLRKLARRNKAALTTAAAIAFVLALGTAVSIWQAVRATRAESRANQERNQAQAEKKRAAEQAEIATAVNGFLNNDLLGQASAFRQSGLDGMTNANLTVREAVDRAAAHVDRDFARLPLVEAAIRFTIADVYFDLFQYDKAIVQDERALQIRRQILGETDPNTQQTIRDLAVNYDSKGEHRTAQSMLLKALEFQQRTNGPLHPDTFRTMSCLGMSYSHQGDFAKATPLLRQALDGLRNSLGPDHVDTLDAEVLLFLAYAEMQCDTEAETLLKDLLERQRRTRGESHPCTLITMMHFGVFFRDLRRFDQAEELLKQAHDACVQQLSEHNPLTIRLKVELANCYLASGRFDRGEALLLQTYQTTQRDKGDRDDQTLALLQWLATMYKNHGQFAQARSRYRQLLDALETNRSNDQPDVRVASVLRDLSVLEYTARNGVEAERLIRQSIDLSRRLKAHRDLENSLRELARWLAEQERFSDVVPLRREDLTVCIRDFPQGSLHIASAKSWLGEALNNIDNYDEAESLLWEAQSELNALVPSPIVTAIRDDTRARLLGLYHRWNKPEKTAAFIKRLAAQAQQAASKNPGDATLLFFGQVLVDQSDFSRAEATLAQYISEKRDALGAAPPDIDLWTGLFRLGFVEHKLQKDHEEEQYYREALEVARRFNTTDALGQTLGEYGAILIRLHKYAEAEPIQRESVQIGQQTSPPGSIYVASQKSALGEVLTKLGRYSEAERILLKAQVEQQVPLRDNKRLWDMRRRGETYRRLIDLYQLLKKPDQVQLWAGKFIDHLRQAAEIDSSNSWARAELAWWLAKAGQFDKSLAQYLEAIRIDPTIYTNWHDGAVPIFLQLGDVPNYLHYCRLEMKQFANTTNKTIAHCVAKDCLMYPMSGDDLDQAVAMAQRGNTGGAFGAQSMGMAEYRRGKFREAIPLFQRSIDGSNAPKDVSALLFIALAQQHLGDHASARATLDDAIRMMETRVPRTPNFEMTHPGDWIICQVIRREAEHEILGIATLSTRPTTTRPSPLITGR